LRYWNELEPAGLVGHFLSHPPEGFEALTPSAGLPGFIADFDLLTTADPQALRYVTALPGHCWLRKLLRWPTYFFGTTVTEYMPMATSIAANALPGHLKEDWGKRTRLLIIKDVPLQSCLLSAAEREYSDTFLAACQQLGFISVEGQALAYVPIDFSSTDDYLSRLSAGRRRDIRRKLRSRAKIRLEILPTGHERFLTEEFLAKLYDLYQEVYSQSEIHFDKLTADFFRAVFQDGTLAGQVFLYYTEGGLIGFNLCFIHGNKLIDKFVGFHYPDARQHNLYFISWMENLEYARSRGLTHYVAGWTDPEIKAYLGARFTFTRHAVYVRHPLLRALLSRLSRFFESDRAWFDEHESSTRS